MFSTFDIYLLFEVCSDLRALAIDSSHTMRKQSFILVVFCLLLWILLCNVWLVVRMSQTRNHHYRRVYTLERKMSSVKWNYKVSQWQLQPLGNKSSRNQVWIHLLWGLSKYNICIYVSLSFNMHKKQHINEVKCLWIHIGAICDFECSGTLWTKSINYIHLEDPQFLMLLVRNILPTSKLEGRKKANFWGKYLNISAIKDGGCTSRTDWSISNTY